MSWATSLLSERTSSTIAGVRAERSDAARRPHRDWARPGYREPGAARSPHSDSICSAPRLTACSTRNTAISWRFMANRPAAGLPGTFNYYGMSADARHYLPIGRKAGAREPSAARQHSPGRRRSGKRSVLEEIFSRRRDEHPGMGPVRGQSAQRVGAADWRQQHDGLQRRNSPHRERQSGRRCCSSTAAMSGPIPGPST